MENNTELYLSEIKEIRKMMAQSSRFLSLSGLSGILVGLYGLAGAFIAWRMLWLVPPSPLQMVFPSEIVGSFLMLGAVTLALALITVIWLTYRRIRKSGNKFWTPGSRLMCISLAVPLVSGGLLILIFITRGVFGVIAPLCLVFYGLALVNAAKFTRQEIFYMGLLQIVLGILAALIPQWSLFFWAAGFGLVHIIYGTVMFFRYEYHSKK
ncbi:MAG: hypothetical protein AAGU19_09300 [Prolixibacteraceae bacterium]